MNLVRAMLGLHPADGRLVAEPSVPREVGRVRVRGVPAFGRRWDVEAVGSEGYVRLAAD